MTYKQQIVKDITDVMKVYNQAGKTRDCSNLLEDVLAINQRNAPSLTAQQAFTPNILTQFEILKMGGPMADKLLDSIVSELRGVTQLQLAGFEEMEDEEVEELRGFIEGFTQECVAQTQAANQVHELDRMFCMVGNGGGDMDDAVISVYGKPLTRFQRFVNFFKR